MGETSEQRKDSASARSVGSVYGDRRWLNVGVLLFIVALAASVRWYRIGQTSIWIDEGASLTIARMPWKTFLQTLWHYEANMATYYLLLRAWVHLGDSEAIVRSLSALCGTVTVAAIYFLGRRLFGVRAGLLAAALLSVHMFHLWLSQEARSYGLVMLLVTLSLLLFVEAVSEPRQRLVWLWYVATNTLAAYAHLFALLVLAAQWLALDPRQLRGIGWRRAAVILSVQGVLLAPLAAFLLQQDHGQVSWIPPTSVAMVLLVVFGINGFNPLVVLLVLVGLAWVLRGVAKGSDEAFELRLVGLGVAFPIAAVALVSIVKPLFFFRYFAVCVPVSVLLAARVLSPSRVQSRAKRVMVAGLGILTLGLSMLGTVDYYGRFKNWAGDWRSATEYVLAHRQSGDAVAFYASAGLDSYRYYRDRVPSRQGSVPLPTVVFPGVGDLASAHLEPTYALLKSASEAHPRLWLVFHQKDARALPAPFPEPYRLVEEKMFSAFAPEMPLKVALYESPSR